MEVHIYKDSSGALHFRAERDAIPELKYVGRTFLTLFTENDDELPLLSPGQDELNA